jgi:hypothetical protein
MQRMRDKPKMDSLVAGLFDELVALQDQPLNIVLGNIGFRGLETIFSEPDDSYRPAFLRFYREGSGRLNLDGQAGGQTHNHVGCFYDLGVLNV